MMKYVIVLLICFIVPEILPCYGNDSMQRLPKPKFRNYYKSILEDVMDSIRGFLAQNAAKEEDLLIDLVTSIEEKNNYLFWAKESKSPSYSSGRNVVDDRKKRKNGKLGGKTTKIPKLFHHSTLKNDDSSHHPGHPLGVASSKLVPNDDSPPHTSSDSPTKPRNYASGQTETNVNKGGSNDAVSIFKGFLISKLGTIESKPPEAKDTNPTQLNFFKPTKDDTLKKKVASPPKTGVDKDDPWKIYVYYALVLIYFCGMIVLGIMIMRPKKDTTITLRKSFETGCSKKTKKDGPGDKGKTVTLYMYYYSKSGRHEEPKKDGDPESQHYSEIVTRLARCYVYRPLAMNGMTHV